MRRATRSGWELLTAGLALVWVGGCDPEEGLGGGGDGGAGGAGGDSGNGGGGGVGSLDEVDDLPGTALTVRPVDGEAYVNLSTVEQLDSADAEGSRDWDLAFFGWRVATNSGPSGSGEGAAFGPSDELNFLFSEAPEVPFLRADAAGGALSDWYEYDGSEHAIWTRFHTYGVRQGDQYWKLQILGYYGELLGAPTAALYSVRFASVTEDGVGETQLIDGIDATAGYPMVTDDAPSACLNLERGEVVPLTPAEASESTDWHVCFRRDAISTNGGVGGPFDVAVADLDLAGTATETIEDLMERTAASEQDAFEGTDFEALTDTEVSYLEDGPTSIFGTNWYDRDGDEFVPTPASWFVRGADGQAHFLVVFRSLTGDEDGPTEIRLQVRPVER